MTGKPEGGPLRPRGPEVGFSHMCTDLEWIQSCRGLVSSLGREVLLNGMSSKKHFSLPERQEYFFDIQPPAPVATFVLQRLDRLSRCGAAREAAEQRALDAFWSVWFHVR